MAESEGGAMMLTVEDLIKKMTINITKEYEGEYVYLGVSLYYDATLICEDSIRIKEG